MNVNLPKGLSTYLNGAPWPQCPEDAFDIPTYTIKPRYFRDGTPVPTITVDTRAQAALPKSPEYRAEFLATGGVALVLYQQTKTNIANFNNFADAQTAAKALNELKGY